MWLLLHSMLCHHHQYHHQYHLGIVLCHWASPLAIWHEGGRPQWRVLALSVGKFLDMLFIHASVDFVHVGQILRYFTHLCNHEHHAQRGHVWWGLTVFRDRK